MVSEDQRKSCETEKAYKKRLAETNFNIVYFVVNMFSSTYFDYDEMYSAALLGYAKAVDTYDFNNSANAKFATYATNCTKNEILYLLKKENRVSKNQTSFSSVLSTDKNGNDLTLEDILCDESLTLEAGVMQKEKFKRLKNKIESLPEEEQRILLNRYSLFGNKEKTQKEIGDEIGMSQANISKTEKNILKKLKSKREIYY